MEEIDGMIRKAALVSGAEAALLQFQIASNLFTVQRWGDALGWYRKVDPELLPDAIGPDLISYQVFMCYYNLKNRNETQEVFELTKKNYPASQFIAPMRQRVELIPR